MKAEIKIPKGWRRVRTGSHCRRGDKIMCGKYGNPVLSGGLFIVIPEMGCGDPVYKFELVIRKVDKI